MVGSIPFDIRRALVRWHPIDRSRALFPVGLGFLQRDAIRWPLMTASLSVALLGFCRGRVMHQFASPFLLDGEGALTFAAGVIVVRAPLAMTVVGDGAFALVFEIVLTTRARRARERLS